MLFLLTRLYSESSLYTPVQPITLGSQGLANRVHLWAILKKYKSRSQIRPKRKFVAYCVEEKSTKHNLSLQILECS